MRDWKETKDSIDISNRMGEGGVNTEGLIAERGVMHCEHI
jgi:hypothetical protein